MLYNLTLILTTRCNLMCSYCFCGEKHDKDMNLKFSKECIDFFSQYSTENPFITFFGGEPLLKLELIDQLSDYIEDKFKGKAKLYITTNGTLINDKFFEIVNRHNINYQVSIDGYGEFHDLNRKFYNGKGSWEVIYQNIKQYTKKYPLVRMTYTSKNIRYLFENIKKLVELGFKELVFMPSDEPRWDDISLEEFRKQYEQICEFYLQCFEEEKEIFFVEFDNIINGYIHSLKPKCNLGINQISIDPLGNIFPCNRVNFNKIDLCLGDIYNGFNKDAYSKFVQGIEKEDIICKECDLQSRCVICKIENYNLTRNLYEIDRSLCYINQCKISLIDKMASRLYNERNNSFLTRFYKNISVS